VEAAAPAAPGAVAAIASRHDVAAAAHD
jgi:hypothetical protein